MTETERDFELKVDLKIGLAEVTYINGTFQEPFLLNVNGGECKPLAAFIVHC